VAGLAPWGVIRLVVRDHLELQSGPRSPRSARLLLLGGFELRWGEAATPAAVGVRRLLALLALRDRPTPRWQVAGMLWPEMTEERAAGNLRSALWRLPHPGLVVRTGGGDLLLADELAVDYREAVGLAGVLLQDGPNQGALDEDSGCLSRELLPGWWDDWVLIERERFRQLRLHALEARCRCLAETGRYAQAVQAGLAAVACEPLRESAQRLVIAVHLAEGNRSEALRQYQGYRRLLREELGLAPSAQLDELIRRLRAR
jgi:DNA-binding SARP family transcriptional activator